MALDADQEQGPLPVAARPITWFAPDRPVEGTVYVRPTTEQSAADAGESADGYED